MPNNEVTVRLLFLFLVAIPVVEIVVLLKVGSWLGILPTVFAILATAFLGMILLKQQGYQMLFSARSKMASGALPASEVLQGFMLAIGGALLLTPGFVTDAIGFSLLIPGLRHLWLKALKPRMSVYGRSDFNQAPPGQSRPRDTIEGEYHRDD